MKGNRAKPDEAVPQVLDTRNLVGRKEISERLEWSVSAVCNWSVRENGFPKPVAWLSMGQVFNWLEVLEWAIDTDRLPLTDEMVGQA